MLFRSSLSLEMPLDGNDGDEDEMGELLESHTVGRPDERLADRILVSLFLEKDVFALIDEPTDHLDAEARAAVVDYLRSKRGFILVSHDRTLLDDCVDHILALNRSGVELQKKNFSS